MSNELQAADGESTAMVTSQPMTQSKSYSVLRKESYHPRNLLMGSAVQQLDDDVHSTHISERRQAENDKMLAEARHYRDAYEKVKGHLSCIACRCIQFDPLHLTVIAYSLLWSVFRPSTVCLSMYNRTWGRRTLGVTGPKYISQPRDSKTVSFSIPSSAVMSTFLFFDAYRRVIVWLNFKKMQ